MNLLEFLNYQKSKDLFTRKSICNLWFSSIITVVLTYFCASVFNYLTIKDSYHIFKYSIINQAFMVLLIGLFFVTSFGVARVLSEIEIPTLIVRRKFKLDFRNIELRELKEYFDFQGHISDHFDKEKCLFLNCSPEGLITRRAFHNPKIIFRAKVLLHGFAVILGAKDLENYLMFRMVLDQQKGFYINPHIRMNGIWETQEVEQKVDLDINAGDVLNFQVEARGNLVIFKIMKDKKDYLFTYLIPSHFGLLPSNEENKNIVSQLKLTSGGKVGFRSYGKDEKTVVYNLEVSEL